jgi:hypothetical protein
LNEASVPAERRGRRRRAVEKIGEWRRQQNDDDDDDDGASA